MTVYITNASQMFMPGTPNNTSLMGCFDMTSTAQFCQTYFANYETLNYLFAFTILITLITSFMFALRTNRLKKAIAENRQLLAELKAQGIQGVQEAPLFPKEAYETEQPKKD